MLVYISTNANKLGVFDLDDTTGNLIATVQTVEPIVDPVPPNVPDTGIKAPATEWIVRHPKHPLLFALTSFWSNHSAILTTFRISPKDGTLEKLGACNTKGLQAAYAEFSPDGSTLCIAHHNDGKLVLFDCSEDKAPEAPVQVIDTPEAVPGTRGQVGALKLLSLPALHHATFILNGKYIMAVDSSPQARVWTYPVNDKGLVVPIVDGDDGKILGPCSTKECNAIRPLPSLFSRFITSFLFGQQHRLRRVALHPNGEYAYVLYESHPILQVYKVDSNKGEITSDCLQEIAVCDESLFGTWNVGLANTSPAELVVAKDGVWVSNRGVNLSPYGRSENGLRFLSYEDNGARLVMKEFIKTKQGVRHFLLFEEDGKIISGANLKEPHVLETYTKQEDGKYAKVGEAHVGMDVFCIVR